MKTDVSKLAATEIGMTLKSFDKSGVWKIYAATFLLFLVSGLVQPQYFAFDHVMQLLVIASFLGIVAMGQTLTVLSGGIDLSLAYTLNLGAVIMTQVATQHGSGTGLVLVFASGLLVGALNGLGIAYLRISPFIMTMAMNSILKSVTYVYTKGNPKGAAPDWLSYLGSGNILGIRSALVIWIVLTIAVVLLLTRTTYGRKLYAIGTSTQVSHLSGIRNNRMIVSVYMLSGLFAVTAGMMSVGFYQQSFLGMGDTLLLPSLAAVVIGGTSIMGGRGGYLGTAAGAIIIYVLLSILTVLQINDAGRQIIYGCVILAVLFLYSRGKSIRS